MGPSPTNPQARLLRALPLLILVAASVAYGVIFGNLSILRFESFNSSINDLGFYNQLMWITIHGGPNAWATHAQASFYATYPWQTGSFLLFVPVYAAFPSPITLLVVQSVGIPLAAIPIYFLGRKYGLSTWACFALGGCYLLNYQVESVNLNDFHLQSFFPLTFFSMVLFYEYGWKRLFLGAGIISIITNPLTLVLTFGFLLVQLLKTPSTEPWYSTIFTRLVGWIRARSVESLLLIGGALLVGFELATGLLGGYHLGGTTPGSGSSGYFSFVSVRLIYFFAAFAPFLAVALLVRETLVLTIPLVVFLAVGSIGFTGFIGRQDTMEYLVVALWGLMLFVKNHEGTVWRARLERVFRSNGSRTSRSTKISVPNITVLAAVGITVVLFVGLSPVSPWNQVPQLIADVNGNPSTISDITPADHFLDSAIALIPADASVLTQNNIPQLTGRYAFQWAFPTKPAPNVSQVDYILSDQSISSFARSWYVFLQPYVESALNSKEFGILAIGYGVMLLERGYHGSPELLGALPYTPSQMNLQSGYYSGSTAVHPAQNDAYFWYGPYVDLPAGNYTATYRLMIGPGAGPSAPIISVVVSNGTVPGPFIWASSEVFADDFPAPNTWVNVALNFTLEGFVAAVEFPGVNPTDAAEIIFGGVTITIDNLAPE